MPPMPTHDSATSEKLVYMANQIGKFFKAQDRDTAPAKIAEHLVKFWDPRMRKAIVAHLDAGGEGLDPETRRAVERLRAPTAST
jgi:formate dehydrogenase subunit delta